MLLVFLGIEPAKFDEAVDEELRLAALVDFPNDVEFRVLFDAVVIIRHASKEVAREVGNLGCGIRIAHGDAEPVVRLIDRQEQRRRAHERRGQMSPQQLNGYRLAGMLDPSPVHAVEIGAVRRRASGGNRRGGKQTIGRHGKTHQPRDWLH
ncbi:MAG: hypothetical protein A2X37_03870 [Elusimicrobia bacterium GWA2_66_18]|nr:MAG: hypothetical protein A2X37_03870 [Elusimicrobia bacterium GWA2_66_18]